MAQAGKVTFLHYDFYAQALAKIERGHRADLSDVEQLINADLIQPRRLLELFSQIENQLFRYPGINPASFRRSVERAVSAAE